MRLRTTPAGLLQKERWRGEVVTLFPSWRTGMIRGDDGHDVFFSENSLALAFGYADASLGLHVSYEVFFVAGAKVPTAINLKPIHGERKSAGSAKRRWTYIHRKCIEGRNKREGRWPLQHCR